MTETTLSAPIRPPLTGASDYTQADLVHALRASGIESGDLIFAHIGLDALGSPYGCATDDETSAMLMRAFDDVLGPTGTLLVPTYTFSFCRQQPFDIEHTATEGGPWSTFGPFLEYFRRRAGTVRSGDPIHSVAGCGPLAAAILGDVPPTCFGPGSVFDRLRAANGKVCTIGVGLSEASFQHFVEESVGVPFRFRKLFTGVVREQGRERKTGWVFNVRILGDESEPHLTRLEAAARAAGICTLAPVGRDAVRTAACAPLYDLIARELRRDPWFTARGPAADPIEMERRRVPPRHFPVSLGANASMTEMIDGLWRLPRDIVSDGYDAALAALARQVPMAVHEYPAGSECWSWIVPERWTCHEAYLETVDGQRLFSYADHPLHVVSYSLPFDGVVSRETLLAHLHVDEKQPDAIPFIFKYYERDWGLCCSKTLRDSLHDDVYRVVIRTTFAFDTLKVGEVVARGSSDETVMLCAHLCHPHMVNDDLSGVVVGIDVMRALLARRDLHYTYRFTIVPETIGSVAYLSRNEHLIPRLTGGLFLEMLGLEHPHALQLSFAGNTPLDEVFGEALRAADPQGWTGAFRTVIGNDERQYNAPGVRAPMLSLSRVVRPESPEWPYRGYHSSNDTPALARRESLEASRDLVLRMIDALEAECVPVNLYKGEVFCSRFGAHIDFYTNPEGNKALFDILFLVDGTRTVRQIAKECGISLEAARGTIAELERRGILRLGPVPAASTASPTASHRPANR